MTASQKCWALAMPKARFRAAMQSHPDLDELLRTVAIERELRNHGALRACPSHRDERLDLV